MKQKEFDRWAKSREWGMPKYVLLTGVVTWGIPMLVIMTFFVPHPKLSTLQSAALWLVAGAGYGIAMWLVQEHRYRKECLTLRSSGTGEKPPAP